MPHLTTIGHPTPFGPTVTPTGINFAFFSQNASSAYIDLFRNPEDTTPYETITLHPYKNRTGDIWHVFVEGLKHGQLYGIRLDGPYKPNSGHRFNPHKLLADPFAKAFVGNYDAHNPALYGYDKSSLLKDHSFSTLDSTPFTAKSVATQPAPINWDTEERPYHSLKKSIIYECHLKGMTAHPSSLSAAPGTYLGLIDKIPHLKKLGITTIELLPIAQFNELEPPNLINPETQKQLKNYWGYATIAFFAPHQSYAKNTQPAAAIDEFRQMIRAFHEEGFEVILDVVFNHSGEGNEMGPTIAFKGLDNNIYYSLDQHGRYKNYSGCGNTLNCNHPVVKTLIIECLRFWLVEMHVDGFRFDLATILGRSANTGNWISDPNLGLLTDIATDPILRGCKLIAEAWDAAGLYKVGHFPKAWAEWNGKFRDDVRRFLRGDDHSVIDFARRIGGSYDLFSDKFDASQSINFITAHDGFTLRDLCSYNQKHNHANGENNKDGSEHNFSDNFGIEGETNSPNIIYKRKKRAKNFLVALFCSRGTPMLLAGDELWRTQNGNNNVYCQDNPLGWIDWTENENSSEILNFTQKIIALRKNYRALRNCEFADPFKKINHNRIRWHGIKLNTPDWEYNSHSLAFELLSYRPKENRFYIAFNAWKEALDFELPKRQWRAIVDTSLKSGEDFLDIDTAPLINTSKITVQPDSVRIFIDLL